MYKNPYNRNDKLKRVKKAHLDKLFDGGLQDKPITALLEKIKLSQSTYYRDQEYIDAYIGGREQRLLSEKSDIDNVINRECTGYYTDEITYMTDEKGVQREIKRVKKWNRPVPVLLIFNAVNKMPDKYQSINKDKIVNEKDIKEIIINYTTK